MDGFGKVAQVVKGEALEILPVKIFFLIGFNLIAFARHLVLAEEGVVYDGIMVATVGALIIAKVVLVADKLPYVAFVEVHTELGREPLTRIMFWRGER